MLLPKVWLFTKQLSHSEAVKVFERQPKPSIDFRRGLQLKVIMSISVVAIFLTQTKTFLVITKAVMLASGLDKLHVWDRVGQEEDGSCVSDNAAGNQHLGGVLCPVQAGQGEAAQCSRQGVDGGECVHVADREQV